MEQQELIIKELTLLQIAMAKKILRIEEMLSSLIKQEEPIEQKPKPWEKFL